MAEQKRQAVPGLGALPQLQPQARPIDTYVRPGEAEFGKPVQTNPFLQLSHALSQLEPTLQRGTVMAAEQYGAEEAAKGEQEFWQNREKWNALIKSGEVPAGASPYFTRGLQRAYVKQLGANYQAELEAAFYGPDGEAARNSDKPEVMVDLMNKVRQDFSEKNLMKGGQPLFQNLDLQEVFNPLAEQGYRSMMQQHASYRVQAREKQYEAAASTQIGGVMDTLAWNNPGTLDNETQTGLYKNAAQRINDVLYNPDNGPVPNGMLAAKANQVLVDTVVAKVVASGDKSLLGVLDYVTNKQGAPIGKTQYAITKRTEAEEHLTSLAIRQEQFQHWKDGLGFEARSRAHTEQSWAQSDAQWERTVETWAKQDRTQDQDTIIDTLAMRIFDGLRRSDPKQGQTIIDDAIARAEKVDWKAAEHLRKLVHTITKQKSDYEDDPTTVALTRMDITTNPLGFNPSRLANAVKEQKMKASTAMQMFDDLDRNRQNGDHPFLRQPFFHSMMDEVKKSMADKLGDDQFGEGAIRAGNATEEMRDEAVEWIRANPQGTPEGFRKYLRSIKDDVIQRNNANYGAEVKQKGADQTKKGEFIRDSTVAAEGEKRQKEADKQAETRTKQDQQKQEQETQRLRKESLQKDVEMFKSAADTGQRTGEGRKILKLSDGRIATERNITVMDKRINDGRPTNIPSIYDGKLVTQEEAIRIIEKNGGVDPDTGRKLKGYYSLTDAEIAARERSARLGKEYGGNR